MGTIKEGCLLSTLKEDLLSPNFYFKSYFLNSVLLFFWLCHCYYQEQIKLSQCDLINYIFMLVLYLRQVTIRIPLTLNHYSVST